MLLVIIGIGAATIVTFAYLSSRDNSAAIGQNVADAAAARWAALAGIEFACAVMETPTEWWTDHDEGVLFQNHPIGAATVTVELEDFETNEPPQLGSRYVTVTSRAVSKGVEQTATVFATVTDPRLIDAVNVDLSEFAAFAIERIEMSENSLISPWQSSPHASLGLPINLGTHATESFRIELLHNASVIGGVVYHVEGASDFLFTDPLLGRTALPDLIPFPAPPAPNNLSEDGSLDDMEMIEFRNDLSEGGVLKGDTEVDFFYLDEIGLSSTFSEFDFDGTDDPFRAVVAGDLSTTGTESRLGLTGDVVIDVLGNVELDGNMLIDIAPNSNVELRVYGIFQLDEAAIELGEGAKLQLFVKDDIDLRDSYIGDSGIVRDNSGYAEWMDVNRIHIFSIMDEDEREPDWRFRENSVVKGHLYAPNAWLRIRDDSALYGRAAVNRLRLSEEGSLFYEPMLDMGIGYTNPDSQLFTESGHIRDEFMQLIDLAEHSLEQLAEDTDLSILYGDLLFGSDGDSGLLSSLTGSLLGSDDDGDNDPTPRVLSVYYELTSFGDDVRRWEERYERAMFRLDSLDSDL